MDEKVSDFNTFFIERCKYYDKAFGAMPGAHLAESSAAAMNDFIEFATQIQFYKGD